jgi:hypothetical protein
MYNNIDPSVDDILFTMVLMFERFKWTLVSRFRISRL